MNALDRFDYADSANPLARGVRPYAQLSDDPAWARLLAVYSPLRRPQIEGDFTARLPPPMPQIDPRLMLPPYADPGYRMPNIPMENLNQMPAQYPTGTLGL